MQSRFQSLLESVAQVAIGYLVAVATQAIVFPAMGIAVSSEQHVQIAAVFTVVSLVRSYCLRRAFNWMHGRRTMTAPGLGI